MHAKVDELCKMLLSELESTPASQQILIGVCGIPGSGKSSLSRRVVSHLNTLHRCTHPDSSDDLSIVVGMDGFHHRRSVLKTFPSPQLAFDRRGAEFTFDSKRFATFVRSLRTNKDILKAPSFDHALKDPVEDDVEVRSNHRIVLVEGLYCNCKVGEWGKAAREFDQRWVCMIDKGEARRRLVERHVQTGVAKDQDEACWRADNNDLPNGDWLMDNLLEPYTVVESLDESTWT